MRGEKTSLANEEAIGRNAQGGVMMKAAPAASFIMIEPKLGHGNDSDTEGTLREELTREPFLAAAGVH